MMIKSRIIINGIKPYIIVLKNINRIAFLLFWYDPFDTDLRIQWEWYGLEI